MCILFFNVLNYKKAEKKETLATMIVTITATIIHMISIH